MDVALACEPDTFRTNAPMQRITFHGALYTLDTALEDIAKMVRAQGGVLTVISEV